MNPQHFGSDLADIQIWIRINPEIRIRIRDNFWLRLNALAEVCALWAQSSYYFFAIGSKDHDDDDDDYYYFFI